MCYAIPAKVEKIQGENAVVDYGGITKTVNINLVDAKIGDYILIHAGFGIEVLNKQSAQEALKVIQKSLENDTSG